MRKTIKNCKRFISLALVFSLFNPLILKAMEEEEDYTLRSIREVLEEDTLLSSEGSSSGSEYILSIPSQNEEELRSPITQADSMVDPTQIVEVEEITDLSNSYVRVFHQELNEGISRSTALKYIISFLGGLVPIIPQIAIAQAMAENYHSEVLGYIFIGAGVLTVSTINTWLILELSEDTRRLIRSATQTKTQSQGCPNWNCVKSLLVGGSSVFLAILGSAANVYLNYKYNDVKWFALITFVYDVIPKTVGFYKFFSLLDLDKFKGLCKKKDFDKQRAMQIIELSQAYFLEKCKRNGTESVREALLNCHSPREVYGYLISDAQPDLTLDTSSQDFLKGIPRKATKYSSIFLPLVSSVFNFTLAFKGYNLIFDDDATVAVFSLLSVAPSFFISWYVIMQAVDNVFDRVNLCTTKIPSNNFFATFHPKINATLFSGSLVLASMSSFVAYYLVTDNLKDTPLDPLKYPLAAFIMSTGFTFDVFSIFTSFKRYGEIICQSLENGASYVTRCLNGLGGIASSFVGLDSTWLNRFVSDTESE